MVGNEKNPGMMVRVFDDLFRFVEEHDEQLRCTVILSYIEIYNENIRDLLNASNTFLELREDSQGNHQVVGLSEINITNSGEVLRLLQKGNKRRTVEPTAANKTSSRSHALLLVSVQQQAKDQNEFHPVRLGKLYMVDLAGSERASQTKNTGKRLKEGAHINKSLLALGNCINALAMRNAKYVNFRDSKLTRLLKEALSGNCKTIMIAHISPATFHYDESRNTLIYADRAKNITNKIRTNMVDVSHHVKQYQSIITELRQEIQRLQDRMEEPQVKLPLQEKYIAGEETVPSKSLSDNEMRELRAALIEAFNKQMEVRRKMMEIDNCLLALSTDLEKLSIVINQWETEKAKFGNRDVPAEDEPEYVRQAWEDIEYIQGEQQKFLTLREDVEKDFEEARERTYKLTESLPAEVSTEEQRELLRLLTQVHKLEVEKMEMQTDQLIREHELRQRDLMIVRYDRQRQLCDEIITKQKMLIDELSSGIKRRKARNAQAARELSELYRIYHQELQDLSTGRDSVMRHLNINPYRPNSVWGLRPLGSSESMWDLSQLEPLHEEEDLRLDTQGHPNSSQSDNVVVRHSRRKGRDSESSTLHTMSEPATPGGRTSSLPPVGMNNYVSRREEIEASTKKISSLAAQRRSLRTSDRQRWEAAATPKRDFLPQLEEGYDPSATRKRDQDSCNIQ